MTKFVTFSLELRVLLGHLFNLLGEQRSHVLLLSDLSSQGVPTRYTVRGFASISSALRHDVTSVTGLVAFSGVHVLTRVLDLVGESVFGLVVQHLEVPTAL